LGPQRSTSQEYRPTYSTYDDVVHSDGFATIRMGDAFEYDSVKAVLDAVKDKPEFVVEVEEETISIKYDGNDKATVEHDQGEQFGDLDIQKLGHNTIENVPKHEIHHGFDILKTGTAEKPLHQDAIHKKCIEHGFDLGAWFIFDSPSNWLYRCNEFSNLSYSECLQKMHEQHAVLRKILNELGYPNIAMTASLERVLGVWRFNKH
jgi:hypothetical protein